MKRSNQIIAIDGPAASGKTTVASMLARRLGFLYVNTGAMYRAFALKVLRAGVAHDDWPTIERLLAAARISLDGRPDGSTIVTLDGEDVSEETKSQEVAKTASIISQLPAVRRYMVSQQRKIARRGGTVAEGRDTTTVVFRNARHKFYIDASLYVRALRRHRELRARGVCVPLYQLMKDLRKRDLADRTRKISPLRKDRDAILIDTTNLTPEQVVEQIEQYLRDSLKQKEKPVTLDGG